MSHNRITLDDMIAKLTLRNETSMSALDAGLLEHLQRLNAGRAPLGEPLSPIVPDSVEEWSLEQDAFSAANHNDVPGWAQQIVKRLWREVCAREKATLEYLLSKDIQCG